MRVPRAGAAVALAVVLALGATACAAEPGRAGRTAPAPSDPGAAPGTTTAAVPRLDERPVAAGEPAGLAAQLATAARAIADTTTPPDVLDAAGHLQQVATVALAARPEWDAPVDAALPQALRASVMADVGAGRELAALVRRPRATLPAWRIRRPPPAEELRRLYAEAEAATGVPWPLLAAVHLVESRMSRIDGNSTAGAQGPMQFLPSTWSAYGEGDVHDDGDAILGAARFLAAHGARDDPEAALFRYNPTSRYVRAVAAYAARMRADERAFLGYHGWEVHYRTTLGDVWLRPGYEADAERPVTAADVG